MRMYILSALFTYLHGITGRLTTYLCVICHLLLAQYCKTLSNYYNLKIIKYLKPPHRFSSVYMF